MANLQPGLSARVELVVADSDTALAVGSGDVAVLATPRLLALCEQATVAAAAPGLDLGETTVGSRVELDHLSPTPVGTPVVAIAVLESVDGPRLTFTVSAVQEGREVARGVVRRVVVDRARFGG